MIDMQCVGAFTINKLKCILETHSWNSRKIMCSLVTVAVVCHVLVWCGVVWCGVYPGGWDHCTRMGEMLTVLPACSFSHLL